MHRDEKRRLSTDEAVAIIRRILAPLQASGSYAELPLVLKMQDGVITTVHSTGAKFTPESAAADSRLNKTSCGRGVTLRSKRNAGGKLARSHRIDYKA